LARNSPTGISVIYILNEMTSEQDQSVKLAATESLTRLYER